MLMNLLTWPHSMNAFQNVLHEYCFFPLVSDLVSNVALYSNDRHGHLFRWWEI